MINPSRDSWRWFDGIGKFTIGALADSANVSKRTIDHYTNMGLLTPERTSSGYRMYSEQDVQALKEIQELQNKGLSLEEIKEQLLPAVETVQDQVQTVHQEIEHLVQLIEKSKAKQDLRPEGVQDTIHMLQQLLHLLS